MDRAITVHMGINEFREAARILNGFNQGDIDARIAGYSEQQRAELYAAADVNGGAAARIRTPIDFGRLVRSGDWTAAARILDSYPEAAHTVPAHLRRLGWWEGVHLLHATEAASLPIAPQIRAVVVEHSAEIATAFPGQLGRNWAAAVRMLNALTDRDLTTAIGPLTGPQLFELNAAATRDGVTRVVNLLSLEPQAGLIHVEQLDRNLRAAIAREDWPAVATTLGQYADDSARRARLQWFHLDQATALADHLRPAGGPLYALVEARRIEKLGQEYEAAISSENWVYACTLLNAYNDTDLLAKAQRIQAVKGAAGLTAAQNISRVLWPDDNHRVRRILLYIPLQAQTGAAARPADPQSWAAGAAAGSAVAVPGGTVTTHEGVSSGTGTADFFALNYQGAQAQQTGWLQFVSEEIERFDAATGGASLGYFIPSGGMLGTGQPTERIEFSSPSDRHWYLDALSNQYPFYEAPVTAGASSAFMAVGTRGSHSTVPSTPAAPSGQTMMVDKPGSVVNYVHEAFAPITSGGFLGIGGTTTTVRRVEHRVQFHQYLVRGNEVLYENTMTVLFAYTTDPGPSGATPARRNIAGTGSTASRLRPEHFQALVRRFHDWGFYPH